jgi:four helix bundle protein
MSFEDLRKRTKLFGLRIIRLAESLPRTSPSFVLTRQLIRSGTSVGANYRAACRARSHAEFIAKLGIVEEECDESLYWMEMLVESGVVRPEKVRDLMKEGAEILAIIVSSRKTAKFRTLVKKKPPP